MAKFLLFLALAFFETSASSVFNTGYLTNRCGTISNGNQGLPLPVINTEITTSLVENPTVEIPSYNMPTLVSEAYHGMKTVVRPQIRNEIITVPKVDRIVRTVSTPVIETVNCGLNRPVEASSQPLKMVSTTTGDKIFPDIFPGNNVNVVNDGKRVIFRYGPTAVSTSQEPNSGASFNSNCSSWTRPNALNEDNGASVLRKYSGPFKADSSLSNFNGGNTQIGTGFSAPLISYYQGNLKSSNTASIHEF